MHIAIQLKNYDFKKNDFTFRIVIKLYCCIKLYCYKNLVFKYKVGNEQFKIYLYIFIINEWFFQYKLSYKIHLI